MICGKRMQNGAINGIEEEKENDRNNSENSGAIYSKEKAING